MPACPSCGRENPDDARFCSACGTPLAARERARESRKVVTVLFCDLVGSTALGAPPRSPLEGCLLARDGRFDDAEDAAQRSIQRLEGIDSERLAVVGIEVA